MYWFLPFHESKLILAKKKRINQNVQHLISEDIFFRKNTKLSRFSIKIIENSMVSNWFVTFIFQLKIMNHTKEKAKQVKELIDIYRWKKEKNILICGFIE